MERIYKYIGDRFTAVEYGGSICQGILALMENVFVVIMDLCWYHLKETQLLLLQDYSGK